MKHINRQTGVFVHWCVNPKCKLWGIGDGHDTCPVCEQPTQKLVSVVVCTQNQPMRPYVVNGLLDYEVYAGIMPSSVTLFNARACVLWRDGGPQRLATDGPDKSCRVTGMVAEKRLDLVQSIMLCSPRAIDRWEEEPWSK